LWGIEACDGGRDVRLHVERRGESTAGGDQTRGIEYVSHDRAKTTEHQAASGVLQLTAKVEQGPECDTGNVLDVAHVQDHFACPVVVHAGSQLPEDSLRHFLVLEMTDAE